MKKKLTICLLSYRSNPHCGGQGIYIANLSKALLELGHDVDVISGQPYPILVKGVCLKKLPSLNLIDEDRFWPKKWWQVFYSWINFKEWIDTRCGKFAEPAAFGRRVLRFLKKQDKHYDIIHDNQTLSKSSLIIQQQFKGFVSTIHHPISKDFKFELMSANTWFKKWSLRQWYSFVETQKHVAAQLKHVITVSNHSKNDIKNEFQVKDTAMDTIPVGIEFELFKYDQSISKKKYELISFANSIQPMKGLTYLLEAVAQCKTLFPELHLKLIHNSPLSVQSQRMIDQLNLAGSVSICKQLSPDELVNQYNEATMLVVPSLYEGFCIPALESIACGTPVVGTRVGALSEIVRTAGVIVSPGNSNELARGIQMVLEKPSYYLAETKKIQHECKQRYDWPAVAYQTTAVYDKILHHANH